jgi:uncharacterized protein
MQIVHDDDGKRGRFYIGENGKTLAELTYKWCHKEEINIEHTFVDEQLKGHGTATKLLTEAVQWARDKNIKIYPGCPFVKSAFEKHAGLYQDVFAPAYKNGVSGDNSVSN